MGLQGRTASGYTGEALPAQANWAGKSRCWLVCHALCSHPADLSFVAAAMHLACVPTAIPSPFLAVPCFGGKSSRNAYTTSHVRESVPPVCTVLYSHSCSAALLSALPFLNCHRSRRDTPLGLPYRPLQSGLPLQINISSASSRPTQSFRTRRPLRWS